MVALQTGLSGQRAISGLSIAYQCLFCVRFRHDYFRDGWARGLAILPDEDSCEWMRQYATEVRQEGASFYFVAEDSGIDRLAGAARDCRLRFEVTTGNGEYSLCTEGFGQQPPPIYLWREDGFTLQEQAASSPPEGLANVLATLEIPLSGFLDQQGGAGNKGIPLLDFHFRPRKTLWKYVLLGDWGIQPLNVVDMRGKVTFSASRMVVQPSGDEAAVFLTEQPIALSEQYDFRFQLRGGEQAEERVLIARLPLASPRSFCKEMVNEEMTLVSEIFVSH